MTQREEISLLVKGINTLLKRVLMTHTESISGTRNFILRVEMRRFLVRSSKPLFPALRRVQKGSAVFTDARNGTYDLELGWKEVTDIL